jgi:hypothetical protein
MSKWFTPDPEDIEFDDKTSEVDIFVCSDCDGGIYLSIPFAMLKELVKKIDAS